MKGREIQCARTQATSAGVAEPEAQVSEPLSLVSSRPCGGVVLRLRLRPDRYSRKTISSSQTGELRRLRNPALLTVSALVASGAFSACMTSRVAYWQSVDQACRKRSYRENNPAGRHAGVTLEVQMLRTFPRPDHFASGGQHSLRAGSYVPYIRREMNLDVSTDMRREVRPH